MKLHFLIAILSIPIISFGQSQICAVLAQSISVRGFKLGMTETEAKRRYPKLGIYDQNDGSGLSTVNISSNLDEVLTEKDVKVSPKSICRF